jgi:hypothetical protein
MVPVMYNAPFQASLGRGCGNSIRLAIRLDHPDARNEKLPMKSLSLLLPLLLCLFLVAGCGKKAAEPVSSVIVPIALLTLDDQLTEKNGELEKELHMTVDWMDRDLLKIFRNAGYQPLLLKKMQDYRTDQGKLFIVSIERFNPGSRAARAFVGFGAGSASLDVSYKLLDERGALLAEWRDGVGSSKGPTYCAQTLNRRALARVSPLLGK